MRHTLVNYSNLLQRIERLEFKQFDVDDRFNQLFSALELKKQYSDEGIFFDGQIYDAWEFVSSLIKKAVYWIILIDNYIDDSVINLFTKKILM